MQRPARVLALALPGLGLPIHAPPAPHDALDVGGRAGAPHPQQPLFGLRRGDPSQGSDLGVRDLPAGKSLGQERQRPERARHADLLPGGPHVDLHPPAQPGRAGAESGVPASARIELTDQIEEASGNGLDVRGHLGDLVAQPVQFRDAIRGGGEDWRLNLHGESPFY